MPIKIGKKCVEEIYKIDFTHEERELWMKTVKSVAENASKVDQFLAKGN